jgi:hypothetical protein
VGPTNLRRMPELSRDGSQPTHQPENGNTRPKKSVTVAALVRIVCVPWRRERFDRSARLHKTPTLSGLILTGE